MLPLIRGCLDIRIIHHEVAQVEGCNCILAHLSVVESLPDATNLADCLIKVVPNLYAI